MAKAFSVLNNHPNSLISMFILRRKMQKRRKKILAIQLMVQTYNNTTKNVWKLSENVISTIEMKLVSVDQHLGIAPAQGYYILEGTLKRKIRNALFFLLFFSFDKNRKWKRKDSYVVTLKRSTKIFKNSYDVFCYHKHNGHLHFSEKVHSLRKLCFVQFSRASLLKWKKVTWLFHQVTIFSRQVIDFLRKALPE